MVDTKKCTKCEGEMRKGRLYTPHSDTHEQKDYIGYVNWKAVDEGKFGGVFAYKCDNCGFIEFFVERPARTK